MKSIVICVLAIALMSTPSHALLGSLIGAITNGISNVVSSVGNTIDTIQNGINLAVLGGQFLWDNAFNPALQTLTSNGAEFIDQYFGGILNAVGKRSAEDQATIIAQKNLVKLNFANQMSTVIAGVKIILFTFLKDAQALVMSSAQGILSGQIKIKELLNQLVQKATLAVQQLVASVAASFVPSVRSMRLPDNKLEIGLKGVFDTLGEWAASAFNVVASYLLLGYTNVSNLLG